LEGLNYLTWSQYALLYIKSRGKMGYFNDRIQGLKLDNPAYDKLEAKNSTTMSWYLHSTQPD